MKKYNINVSVLKLLIFNAIFCLMMSSCIGNSGSGLDHEISTIYIQHPGYGDLYSETIVAKFGSFKLTRTGRNNIITEEEIIYLTQVEIDQLNELMNPFDSSLDSKVIISGPNNSGGGGPGYGISIDDRNFHLTQYGYPQYVWSERISKIYYLMQQIARNRYPWYQIGKIKNNKDHIINLYI